MLTQSLTLSGLGLSTPHSAVAPLLGAAPFSPAPYLKDSTPGSRIAALMGDAAITHRHRKPGDHLFRAGGAFHFFYVLIAGFAKSCHFSEDGRERTSGVHLRGDILGLDGVATGAYACDAVALDACEVLAIPYALVLAQCERQPALVHELHRAFSAEIYIGRNLMLSLGQRSAEGRVASFLLDISVRFASRGFSATQLRLHLSRQEIGSMLGLQLETVSRTFSQFAKLGLITVCLREIVLLDRDGLQDMMALPVGAASNSMKGNSRSSFGWGPSSAPVSPALLSEIAPVNVDSYRRRLT